MNSKSETIVSKKRTKIIWEDVFILGNCVKLAKAFDRKVDGGLSFFFKHYGKTRFMISMSKKLQYLGLERLFEKGPKAFFYFFMFYLIRDTILYILIPIWLATYTTN